MPCHAIDIHIDRYPAVTDHGHLSQHPAHCTGLHNLWNNLEMNRTYQCPLASAPQRAASAAVAVVAAAAAAAAVVAPPPAVVPAGKDGSPAAS